MSRHGNLDMGGSGRIINLPNPLTAREPALSRDSFEYKRIQGRFFSQAVTSALTSSVSIGGNIAVYSALEIRSDVTINSITTEVVTALAGSFYQVALYNINPLTGYLTDRAAGSGTDRSGAIAGVITDVLVTPVLLRAGVYACVLKASGTIAFRSVQASGIGMYFGMSTPSAFITRPQVPFPWVANTPFPATFPAGLAVSNTVNSAVPIFLFNPV